jgi:hypothetical protein
MSNPYDNPTVGSNANRTFPFDPIASSILLRLPPGLSVSDEQFAEFTGPSKPDGRSLAMTASRPFLDAAEDDAGVNAAQHSKMMALRDTAIENLSDWVTARDVQTSDKGYGALSKAMRKNGCDAWMAIKQMDDLGIEIVKTAEPDTRAKLAGFMDVMWAYGQCLAFELEASRDGVSMGDVRETRERQLDPKSRWQPAIKPSNVQRVIAGTQQLADSDTDRSFPTLPSAGADDPADVVDWDDSELVRNPEWEDWVKAGHAADDPQAPPEWEKFPVYDPTADPEHDPENDPQKAPER